MVTAANEEKFGWTDQRVLPVGAAGAYPKTRVWGSSEKTLPYSSVMPLLTTQPRRGYEQSSVKTAIGPSFDSNGNTLTKTVGSNTTTYAWDFENRLTSVTLPNSGGTVSFSYDPFGRRIEKSSSATTSVFAYDGDNLIEEANSSGGVVARYTQTQNIDEPLAMLRSGGTSYYNADGLGSVTSLTNSSGAVAETYTYDAFGMVMTSSGSLTNPFQYTGRELDPETGLYFYRARYYDPLAGRFMSEDPSRFQAGPNFFAYTDNNATNLIDPTGLLQVCCRKADIGNKMFWVSKENKPCHCFLKLSDGHTMGGYNKPPGILHKKIDDTDDKNPKNPPTCTDVPGSECAIRHAYQNYPTYQPYGLGGTSNTTAAQILADAGITYTFPSCSWGSGWIPHWDDPRGLLP